MIKTFCFFFCLLAGCCCFAQDKLYAISPQLSIVFPQPPDSMKTSGVKVYVLRTPDAYYQVGAADEHFRIRNEKDFRSGLKGFGEGLEKKLPGYAIQKKDSTIDGIEGVSLFAVSRDTAANAMQLFMFYTIVDGRCQFVQWYSSLNKPDLSSMNRFFRSIHFHGENYPATTTAYRVGNVIGQLLGYAVLLTFVGVLGWLLIRFVLKMKRPAKRQN